MAGLSLRNLRIAEFRSHRQAVLSPGPGLVALYGPNGAGKTNVLEAISLLSPGRGLRRAQVTELARAPARVGWRIRAEVAAPSGVLEIVTGAVGEAPRSVEIDGKAATQAALGHHLRVLWLVPAMDRLWLEGAAERRRFLDRITLSLAPGHAEASIAYERAMRERNRLFRDDVRDTAWFEALEAQMARAGAEISARRAEALARLTAAQDAAETAFPAADVTLLGPDGGSPAPADAERLAAALAEGRGRDRVAGRTLTGPHRDDLSAIYAAKGVEARLCSTGEQKALLISLVLANARAVAADFGAPPILLLDEVAAHLDADRRAALYAEIAGIGAQAWMTGTDAALFEALPEGAERLEVREAEGESVVERV
ncbi:MAG: DNA replication/repair protein RecF [Pseudomonadota bacterium]